ncbi:MAG: cell division protein FtsQ/DivIB [Gammaproteobacteria bacterium]|jgi:cell division protein FtsQ
MRARTNRRKAPPRTFRLPRLRINWRRVLAVPALAAAIIAGALGIEAALDRPVERLSIEAPFQRVTSVQIEAVVGPEIGRGFLSVDLSALRARLEAIDWVDRATVWRRWPGTLSVRIYEHTAAARWGSSGLLNVNGELFTEDSRHSFPELPLLEGPDGSERRVAKLYLAIRDRLSGAQLTLTMLRMDERGALAFRLAGGQEIRVGREAVSERLDRFFEIATPTLVSDLDQIEYVDLRYANGFAVGWRERPDNVIANNRESF